MSNDIAIKNTSTPAQTNVAQTGDKNVNIVNYPGAKVELHQHISNASSSEMERMIAIDSFSSEYYQLIVTDDENAFNTCRIAIPTNMALSRRQVPAEILERCSSLTDDGIAELRTFPAIICKMNTGYRGETDPRQLSVYAYITGIERSGANILISFVGLATFKQHLLCEPRASEHLELVMDCDLTDLNRCAWSVRAVDLFKGFDLMGLSGLPKPSNYGGIK